MLCIDMQSHNAVVICRLGSEKAHVAPDGAGAECGGARCVCRHRGGLPGHVRRGPGAPGNPIGLFPRSCNRPEIPQCVWVSKYRLKAGSVSCWYAARAQVLAAQRGKEAAEEREQNVSLREEVEALRSAAASAAQVRLLTAGCGFA